METIWIKTEALEQNTGQVPGLPANPRQWTQTDIDRIARSLEETFELGNHDTLCLTAGDFVLDGADLPEKSVVDMELAYIAAFGFASVMSIKYVSDALNLRQYNERR